MFKKLLINGLLILATLGFAGAAFASSLPVGGQTYYLAGAGVTTSQTTVQLTSFKTADGTLLTMSNFGTIGYGTLESQTPAKVEFISFTGVTQNANGTATLTGVVRGVGFVYPYSSVLSLEKSHAGGASFIISNTPEFYYNEFSMQNNSNVFTYPTASTSPATKGYVDATAFSGSGAIAATTIALGYVQIATPAQAAASTGNGSTGAVLVIPSSTATSTFNTLTAGNRVIVTGTTGAIDPNFLPIVATTSTIANLPIVTIGKNYQVFTSTGTFTVPTGITKVNVQICGGGGGSAGLANGGPSAGGGAGGFSFGVVNVSATTSIEVDIGAAGALGAAGNNPGGNGGTTRFSTFMSTTGGNGSTGGGTMTTGGVGGTATGGTVNSSGQQGGSSTVVSTTYLYGIGASGPFGITYCSGGNGVQIATGNSIPGLAGTAGLAIVNW